MADSLKLAALRLTLEGLGQPLSKDTVDDRKRLQKAIYLAQAAGANLGYRFSWYLMGPYSSELADDYYVLESAEANSNKQLRPEYISILNMVKAAWEKPANVALAPVEWLELLASYCYLRRVSLLNHEAAAAKLHEKKPQLSAYIGDAKKAICDTVLFSVTS